VLRIELHSRAAAGAREALPARLAVAGTAVPRVVAAAGGGAEGAGSAFALHYDTDALTLALIARTQQRPDVEYAQANRLLRPVAAPATAASR
jgi:hypothetical protein